MSDYGLFEAASTDGLEEAARHKAAEKSLDHIVFAAQERFGSFLRSATTARDFDDRLALVKPELRELIEAHGVMPVHGIVRRVSKSMRPDFSKQARRKQAQFDVGETVFLPDGDSGEVAEYPYTAPDGTVYYTQIKVDHEDGSEWIGPVDEVQSADQLYRDDRYSKRKQAGLNWTNHRDGGLMAQIDERTMAYVVGNNWTVVDISEGYSDVVAEGTAGSEEEAKAAAEASVSGGTTAKRKKAEYGDYDYLPVDDYDHRNPDSFSSDPNETSDVSKLNLPQLPDWEEEQAKWADDPVREYSRTKGSGVEDAPVLVPEGDWEGYLEDVSPQSKPAVEKHFVDKKDARRKRATDDGEYGGLPEDNPRHVDWDSPQIVDEFKAWDGGMSSRMGDPDAIDDAIDEFLSQNPGQYSDAEIADLQRALTAKRKQADEYGDVFITPESAANDFREWLDGRTPDYDLFDEFLEQYPYADQIDESIDRALVQVIDRYGKRRKKADYAEQLDWTEGDGGWMFTFGPAANGVTGTIVGKSEAEGGGWDWVVEGGMAGTLGSGTEKFLDAAFEAAEKLIISNGGQGSGAIFTKRKAAATHTGFWNKESQNVWVGEGDYLAGGEGQQLGTASTALEAYDLFAGAGYTRTGDLGPTPGVPSIYSCTLTKGTEASRKIAHDWKFDTQFQQFLLDVYGTTHGLTDDEIIEAMEQYSGIGPAVTQEPALAPEEPAPDITNLAAGRKRAYEEEEEDDGLLREVPEGKFFDPITEELYDDDAGINDRSLPPGFVYDPITEQVYKDDGTSDAMRWSSRRKQSGAPEGSCPECEGGGRVTYTTDDGYLSTKTCPNCGGYGTADGSDPFARK